MDLFSLISYLTVHLILEGTGRPTLSNDTSVLADDTSGVTVNNEHRRDWTGVLAYPQVA